MARVSLFAVLLALAACVPRHNRLEPYSKDEALALAIEARAARECSEIHPGEVPPNPFTTDGCSIWPDSTWVDCCVEHDFRYWCGGTWEERRRADRELRECVEQHAPMWATPMYLGVRLGGAPWNPVPWRWGYGWGGIHCYADADAE